MNQITADDFALFAQVAASQSLSAVARQRNVAPSWVSRALSRIEAQCKLRLAHRTTHGLSLTSDGEIFLEHAQRILAEHAQLQDQLQGRNQEVRGTVVISVSQLFAQHVVIAQLPQLRKLHPQLAVNLQLDDRVVSLAVAGVDIAVRAGVAPEETLVARFLGQHGRALYAAPSYAATHGLPQTPADLAAHALIGNTASASHNHWSFHVEGQVKPYPVQGQLCVNSSAGVVSMALAGAGIARINQVVADALVQQGQLLPVLADYVVPGSYPVYAVVLAERHRAAKIHAALAFLETCFAAFKPAQR